MGYQTSAPLAPAVPELKWRETRALAPAATEEATRALRSWLMFSEGRESSSRVMWTLTPW